MGCWIDLIERSKNEGKCKREDILDRMSGAGYDVEQNVNLLTKLYIKGTKFV